MIAGLTVPKTASVARVFHKITFGDQLNDLISVAQHLHELRVNDDYEEFRAVCIRIGLNQTVVTLSGKQEESLFYWKRLDCRKSEIPLADVKSNTQLASHLGIGLNNGDTPRCRLLYRLVQCFFPDLFLVHINDGPHLPPQEAKGRRGRVTMFDAKHGGSWKMRLYTLFQGHHPSDFVDKQLAQSCQSLRTHLGEDFGLRFGKLLFGLKMIIPDETVSRLIGAIIRKAREGKEVHLVGAFCPDYAYEETGNPDLPYRYTFDGLGTGVGLVAQQFARVVPRLSQFLTEQGVLHHITLGIGDFEADDESVCERVGCDYREFVRRCAASLDAFREISGEDLPLTLELCDADRCNGKFRPYAMQATERMMRGDFGRMREMYPNPESLIEQIVKENGVFYCRWFKKYLTPSQIREIVLRQGGEYSALARIYAEDFGDNVINISGDRPLMHTFDAVDVIQPVLCVKRAY